MRFTLGVTLLTSALLTAAAGCTSRPSQEAVTAVDDTVRMILAAYEHDRITLDSAAQRLADIIEPFGSLAASGSISPKAREALEAAGRELAHRAARREP